MKIRQILENDDPFAPEKSTPDSHGRNVVTQMYMHTKANIIFSDWFRKGIIQRVTHPTWEWIPLDAWSKGLGILDIPKNAKYIREAKRLMASRQHALEKLMTGPVVDGMDHTHVSELLDFILTRVQCIEDEAQSLFQDTGRDDEDDSYFITRFQYTGRLSNNARQYWFKVYDKDEDVYYAKVANKDVAEVREMVELGNQVNKWSEQLKKINNLT